MSLRIIALAATLMVAFVGCADRSATPALNFHPEPGDAALDSLLTYYDNRYNPDVDLVRDAFSTPGYHSAIPAGSPVHPTRESLIYALALFQRDGEGDAHRAANIIRAVLRLQDTDPASETCGVWPWVLEEPLAEMESPDFNWADFCGAQLVQMLVQHCPQLPANLQGQMRDSLRLAANAIRRRDVGPGYTNIAIIGGSVCAASGELLKDEDLLLYGRARLQKVVEHTQQQGNFNEYNSPPYACVVLGECERTLQIVRDQETRAAAEALRRMS